jgi:hypothetical protein
MKSVSVALKVHDTPPLVDAYSDQTPELSSMA